MHEKPKNEIEPNPPTAAPSPTTERKPELSIKKPSFAPPKPPQAAVSKPLTPENLQQLPTVKACQTNVMTFQQQFEHAKVSLIRTQKPKAEGEKVSLVDGLRANQATDSSASAVPPHPGSVQDAVAEEVFPATSAIFDLDISGLRHSDSVRGSSRDESFSNLAPREDLHQSALPTKKAGPPSLHQTSSLIVPSKKTPNPAEKDNKVFPNGSGIDCSGAPSEVDAAPQRAEEPVRELGSQHADPRAGAAGARQTHPPLRPRPTPTTYAAPTAYAPPSDLHNDQTPIMPATHQHGSRHDTTSTPTTKRSAHQFLQFGGIKRGGRWTTGPAEKAEQLGFLIETYKIKKLLSKKTQHCHRGGGGRELCAKTKKRTPTWDEYRSWNKNGWGTMLRHSYTQEEKWDRLRTGHVPDHVLKDPALKAAFAKGQQIREQNDRSQFLRPGAPGWLPDDLIRRGFADLRALYESKKVRLTPQKFSAQFCGPRMRRLGMSCQDRSGAAIQRVAFGSADDDSGPGRVRTTPEPDAAALLALSRSLDFW